MDEVPRANAGKGGLVFLADVVAVLVTPLAGAATALLLTVTPVLWAAPQEAVRAVRGIIAALFLRERLPDVEVRRLTAGETAPLMGL